MEIAVIGGGINGIMSAWALAEDGHNVSVFEKNTIMSQTSSASTKLLHGGLRYLENYEFRLVYEGLHERKWWIDNAPKYAHPIQIYIPIYTDTRRPTWMYSLGLKAYNLLSGKMKLGKAKSYSKNQVIKQCPSLKTHNLLKGFSFIDGQMDDLALGLWAAESVKNMGVKIYENTEVFNLTTDGTIKTDNEEFTFDRIINIGGPWAEKLLRTSNIKSKISLDLIRGSHIVIEGNIPHGYLLEVPHEDRIFFVLPYKGKILIGTTEVEQSIEDPIQASSAEIEYLINAYNHYFQHPIQHFDIVETFAGVRPLIKTNDSPSQTTREYEFERNDKLITVFGGKWTTSRQLGKKVCEYIN